MSIYFVFLKEKDLINLMEDFSFRQYNGNTCYDFLCAWCI